MTESQPVSEEMAVAVFAAYDDELVLGDQIIVDWCPHTADYQYRHDCADWCERPVSRMVWTASYPPSLPESPRP